ncbi:MAG: hypothetical protein IPN17_37200 [Deltaproteobacteria bacterium]|nr:hypothetical protein [Deltaproteobacteria bacterium]
MAKVRPLQARVPRVERALAQTDADDVAVERSVSCRDDQHQRERRLVDELALLGAEVLMPVSDEPVQVAVAVASRRALELRDGSRGEHRPECDEGLSVVTACGGVRASEEQPIHVLKRAGHGHFGANLEAARGLLREEQAEEVVPRRPTLTHRRTTA